MKVLHVIPAYYPATYWGGPIFSVYALNNALAELPGVELTVLATDTAGPRLADRLAPDTLPPNLYPNQRVEFVRRVAGACVSPALLRRLPALVRAADVVHLTSAYSFPTLPTLLLCRLLGKPLVWSPRGAIQDVHEWKGAPRRWPKRLFDMLSNSLARPGRVIAHVTSERERIATQQRLPCTRAVVVANGVQMPAMVPSREWRPGDRLRLLYMGRLSPKKGIENLLDALPLLNDVEVELMICGTGEQGYVDALRQRAADLGLTDMVRFAGHVDGAAKTAAFAKADLCVVPSHTENFCMVVAEALAHGVPVVASHGTPWAEIEQKGCGLWVDNDPASLARAILSLREQDLAAMGERGRDWMRADYDWSGIARAMHEIYRGLM